MNKRIKALADHAGIELSLEDPGALEKFIESIILECASVCEQNGESYKHSFTPAKAAVAESTSVFCSDLIKRYFGVESK